jgi:hypothetical protein
LREKLGGNVVENQDGIGLNEQFSLCSWENVLDMGNIGDGFLLVWVEKVLHLQDEFMVKGSDFAFIDKHALARIKTSIFDF